MTASFSSIGFISVFADKVDVAQIDEDAETLTQDKNQILLMKGVCKNDQSAAEAEIPEDFRHDAFFGAFAGDPLHDKAHHEQALAEEADKSPQSQVRDDPSDNILHFPVSLVFSRRKAVGELM